MSRRQSRVSTDVRQNDTLLEFENFKKKFLLANKHITKLNSTLSVRIEELNAQISTLYVENLRLRASEIALTSQLKREKEKSKKILTDAEAATHTLMKHLGHIRKSFNVPNGRSSTPESTTPPRPRARRPIPDPNISPPIGRLARAPNVPGIYEDDEANLSSPEPSAEEEASPSPTVRRKSKSRSSSSRLPLPTRVSSPPPIEIPRIDFDEQLNKVGKRKPTRRQSGLLGASSMVASGSNIVEAIPPRPPSPAFGSPLRREAGLAEEQEETAVGVMVDVEDQEAEALLETIARRGKKKLRETEKDVGADGDRNRLRERERKRVRDPDEPLATVGNKKLKDVTNSPQSRSILPQLDITSDHGHRIHPDGDIPSSATSATTSVSLVSTRAFLTTPATTPALTSRPSSTSYLPSPRSSSPVPPPAAAMSDADPAISGRERRVRKSINYAEPKLNTKMRKPDSASTKRASMSSVYSEKPRSSSSSAEAPDTQSVDPSETPLTTEPVAGIKRKKSRAYVPPEDGEESEGTQADAEYGGLRNVGWANVDGRRRSGLGGASRRIEGDDTRRHSMAV